MCFVGGRASGEDGPVGSRSDDNRVFTFYFFVCARNECDFTLL